LLKKKKKKKKKKKHGHFFLVKHPLPIAASSNVPSLWSRPGMVRLVGDVTDPGTMKRVAAELRRWGADRPAAPRVVLSDMAPRLTGIRVTDTAASVALVDAAIDYAVKFIAEPGLSGVMVAKLLAGAQSDAELQRRLRSQFSQIKWVRPKATRTESTETFVVARIDQRKPKGSGGLN
jgi:23S rRNA (uridine2552-2'-O)-methyltransferase